MKSFKILILPLLLAAILATGNAYANTAQVVINQNTSVQIGDGSTQINFNTVTLGVNSSTNPTSFPIVNITAYTATPWYITFQCTDFTGRTYAETIDAATNLVFTPTGGTITKTSGGSTVGPPTETGVSGNIETGFAVVQSTNQGGNTRPGSRGTFTYDLAEANMVLTIPDDIANDTYTADFTATFNLGTP